MVAPERAEPMYSSGITNSVTTRSGKSSPLEIFIVLLMAGHVGGILGMLVAIPSYTVIRVIAARFFTHFKPIRRLVASTQDIKPTQDT